MKVMGIVHGSAAQAQPLIVGKDTVYVHTDIQQITQDVEGNPVENLYQYREIQYDKDEYIAFIAQTAQETDTALTALSGMVIENEYQKSMEVIYNV